LFLPGTLIPTNIGFVVKTTGTSIYESILGTIKTGCTMSFNHQAPGLLYCTVLSCNPSSAEHRDEFRGL
jgi:hypothetical protein